jgi:hypothetical protein
MGYGSNVHVVHEWNVFRTNFSKTINSSYQKDNINVIGKVCIYLGILLLRLITITVSMLRTRYLVQNRQLLL